MTDLSRPLIAEAPQSAAACAHCGAALAPGQGRFCCTGCEAAYGLVRGLGLDAFYRRREGADGGLRPEAAPPVFDARPLIHEEADGVKSLDLMISGLTCGACVWLVEQALAVEPDVIKARVSFTTHRLDLRWRGAPSRGNELIALLARLGFRVAPYTPACMRATEDAEGRALIRALGIAAFGAMNVMLVSIAVWVGDDMGAHTRAFMHWLAALIGLPTVLVAGMPFYRSASAALRAGRVNMDMAVSLGVLATAGMSLVETFGNGPYTWFDGATALLALLLAGRVLDRAARKKARQAVAELLALQDGMVALIAADGTTRLVPAASVEAGQAVQIAAGETLRLDGQASVETFLDTAAITGESLPRRFAAGAALPAGAVNMGAPFTLQVTAPARDGSLAAMARLLEAAEQTKGRFVSLADRAARFYVPIAHAIAAATFLLWWVGFGALWQEALVNAVCVLLITCPCGLAIAVPAVQVVANGALFKRGVLVASATALERLAEADCAVLDKTGTLTEGRPVLIAEGQEPQTLRAAAGMARASRHPLAKALVRACPEAPLLPDTREIPGQGLEAGAARLGSPGFCDVVGLSDGMVLVYRAGAEAAPVIFRFADRLRADAPQAVADLKALGLPVELLSGDGPGAVGAAAMAAGIESWRAEADPRAKAAHIESLKAAGRKPLMVGDGINDAAALAAAHVAASPAGATDLAQTTADIVLQREGLAVLPDAIRIARRAQILARQNIGFAFAYNLVAVPAAIAGLVNPLIAALVMASSSLIVIGNALRAGRA
ncbi:MAG: heavy metal translocating P-type ATPase [Roseomonas sp.]|nr:heavy metal translocating P-type ATPase [Roseomonas sp.]MCA3331235.1 heavy metal translocating P-type ATPase [Roseomonas sp.]MCA3334767.1 heavy metal translocating P-type ATPase [Roseomonas sp.]MCA3352835.1 heavy metal translocating P-type ATPase [Roseomonas sp.]MCA3372001.1 heavy metal translocating P-type ATPase [Roseomonas sp.]